MNENLNRSGDVPLRHEQIHVREIPLMVSRKMIEDHHYLHKWTPSTVCLGVFKDDDPNPIGTIVYGTICGRPVLGGLFTKPEIPIGSEKVFVPSNQSVWELKRMWVRDKTGFNGESISISKSFDWLRENRPEVRVVLSYSSPSDGHKGTIYQSTNWWFQDLYGGLQSSGFSLSFKHPDRTEPHEWIHSRTLGHIYGGRSLDVLTRKIGRTFWIREDVHKYRYIYFLGGKTERKRLMEHLVHPATREYPKKTVDSGRIQEIRVVTE
jgi:hypothetical protein